VRVRNRAAAFAALVRLPNGLVAAAAVLVGGRWGRAGWLNPHVALAALSAVALTAVANAYNDALDGDIDVVAHPERPVPSGVISPQVAKEVAVLAAVVGVLLAAAARGPLGVFSTAVIVVMVSYDAIKAWSGVLANATVAVLGSLPFLYGAWAAGSPGAALPLMALAAPLQFGREVAKDIDDVSGDRGRRNTLPIVLGLSGARGIGVIAALLAVAMLAAIGARVGPFIGLALLPAVVVVLFGCWQLLHGRAGPSSAFKLGMVLAILPLLIVRAS
jgi:geranylgeranylglycerol-phosphate geranylgeranyltransferase